MIPVEELARLSGGAECDGIQRQTPRDTFGEQLNKSGLGYASGSQVWLSWRVVTYLDCIVERNATAINAKIHHPWF